MGLLFHLRPLGIVDGGVVDGLDSWHPRRTKRGYAITAACSRLGEAVGIDKSLMPASTALIERDVLLPAQADMAEAGYALRWSWRVKGRARLAMDLEIAKLAPASIVGASDAV